MSPVALARPSSLANGTLRPSPGRAVISGSPGMLLLLPPHSTVLDGRLYPDTILPSRIICSCLALHVDGQVRTNSTCTVGQSEPGLNLVLGKRGFEAHKLTRRRDHGGLGVV